MNLSYLNILITRFGLNLSFLEILVARFGLNLLTLRIVAMFSLTFSNLDISSWGRHEPFLP